MELVLQRILELLERKSALFWVVTGIIVVGLLGVLDYLTGNAIVFSLFYLVPIVLVTLAVDEKVGVLMSILSALTILSANIAARHASPHPAIYILNTLIRIVFFSLFCYLVAALHRLQQSERLAARTDYVTGAINARRFNELLQLEIERIRRYPHPFTIVFIDIDDFKLVNDLLGHRAGDNVLRFITDELKSHLRKTDVLARVGGDEFAVLLPSTRQRDAEVVLSKVHSALGDAMKENNLPVTFSMGVVTCITPPYAAEQLINLADELMYTVKNTTKNGVRFTTLGNTPGIIEKT